MCRTFQKTTVYGCREKMCAGHVLKQQHGLFKVSGPTTPFWLAGLMSTFSNMTTRKPIPIVSPSSPCMYACIRTLSLHHF